MYEKSDLEILVKLMLILRLFQTLFFQDFEFSRSLIRRGVALHLLNKRTYGQIVNLINLPEGKLHPELFRIFENHGIILDYPVKA